MRYQTLLTHIKDKILTISLNRPDVRNAFNAALIGDLTDIFKQEATSKEIRAVILKGEGKVFCAGGDLQWMKDSANLTREENFKDACKLSSMLEAINSLNKIVVGCVHGAALGGGMGLVSVCDYVIAEKSAQFGFTEVKLGLIPATIGPYVIAKIGESHARALFLSAAIFQAERAQGIGLIHEVSDLDPWEASYKLAQSITQLSPQAVKTAKQFLSQLKNKPPTERNVFAAHTLADLRQTGEAQEGILAFLEKRKPNW